MRYLFLRYEDEGEGMTAPVHDALNDACLRNDQALRESGYLVEAGSVSHDLITVQFVHDQLTLTTGSLASHPLTSFCLIQARDLNEALQIAARMPQVRRGRIVVGASSKQ